VGPVHCALGFGCKQAHEEMVTHRTHLTLVEWRVVSGEWSVSGRARTKGKSVEDRFMRELEIYLDINFRTVGGDIFVETFHEQFRHGFTTLEHLRLISTSSYMRRTTIVLCTQVHHGHHFSM
jgi:hypothetical protein